MKEEESGEVNSLGFSENGYILASSSKKEGAVRVWDMRHSKCVKTFKENIVAP